IIVNYSNSQRAGVILYLTALIFGAYEKTILDDCTAADKKYVAYCDPPQAENLESEILFR
ncbi:hypothetical protein, partial [Faecalicatena contorta]|uniref:hypothetical protein n=1 Tax=Faecalicatena contorta TaxID=39482 RepID=UPI00195FB3E4